MYNLYGRESEMIFHAKAKKEGEWERKFAFFLVPVGTVDGQPISAWLQFYEVRYVVNSGLHMREYRLPNPPEGFKNLVTGSGLDII